LKNIYSILVGALDKENSLALATIIDTSASTPQVKGASAIFSKKGLVAGTVGGGILESETQKKAVQAIRNKTPLLFEYNLETDISSAEGSLCGGYVKILINTSLSGQKDIFRDILKSLSDSNAGILATTIESKKDDQVEVRQVWIEESPDKPSTDDNFMQQYEDEIITCLHDRSCKLIKIEDTDKEPCTLLFLQSLYPLPELIIAGAGHIGKALTHFANLLDFEITVIDDRKEYANNQNLPDADHIIVDPVGKAMKKIKYGPDTYVVIVTRGHKDDAAALRACIRSSATYIGMIGSKRKIRMMRDEFLAKGWASEEEYDSVHAPIGLEIHSKTVHEIAISICAQLIRIRQQNLITRNKPIISAMILAAGESKRMGQPKMLMSFGQTTIIEQIIHELIKSLADSILVVTGASGDAIREVIKGYSVTYSDNPDYSSGMITSIQTGFRKMKGEVAAVMVLLGDQPMIQTSLIDKLIAAYYRSGKGIIQATYNGKRGHPVIIDKKYRNEILSMTKEESLRDLLRTHPDDIYEVNTNSPEILRDIDTMEDYENEIKHLNKS